MSIKDFEILSKIGDGKSSNLFKVKRIIDNGIYALKKVKLEDLSNKEIQSAIN
jgi:NIMA (never in mitosis gene a)-related kinase